MSAGSAPASLPRVCVLTAGTASRMGSLGQVANKALLPYRDRAILSHLIAAFPAGTPFVVALGHKGRQIRDYLSLAHPDVPVTFVKVDRYEGEGTGPGYSLECCRDHLQQPFYFVPCDGLYPQVPAEAPADNWVGLAEVPPDQASAYCNMALDGDGRVVSIRDKQACDGHLAFTGLLFVRDCDVFWQALASPTTIAGERQISNGLQAFLARGTLTGSRIPWTDLGDLDRYRAAAAAEGFDFSKPNEFLYLFEDRVLKFFADPAVVAGRVAKLRHKPAVFPDLLGAGEQIYAYRWVPGATVYERLTPPLFARLLAWLDTRLWTPAQASPEGMGPAPEARMASMCDAFYRVKTLERVAAYTRKHPGLPEPARVNGEPVRPLAALLAAVPWESLQAGVPAFMHGDLQFDNALVTEAGGFVLLDWRQDFAGETAFGDLYYDLAKLLGGILLNYDCIKKDLLTCEDGGGAVAEAYVEFAHRAGCRRYQALLRDYVTGRGLDHGRVELLASLILINMAPLHHPPFDRALHHLGRLLLERALTGRPIWP